MLNELLHRRENRLVLFFESVARFFVLASLVLVPLAYLPWTSDSLEINKQTILVFCAIFALLAWLGSFIVQKRIAYKKSTIFVLSGLLVLSIAIASVTSLSTYVSIFGGLQQEYLSLLTWIACAVIFLVAMHVIELKKHLYKALSLYFITSGFILLIAVLDIFGISFFSENFIGAANALGIVAATSLVMSLVFILLSNQFSKINLKESFGRIGYWSIYAIVPLSIILLYVIDYWILWFLVVFSMAMIFSIQLFKKGDQALMRNWFLPMLLFVASIVFIFFPTPGAYVYQAEIAPTYVASWDIAKQSLGQSSWLFGSGPGTFEIDYNLFKSQELNNTDFWSLTFNRSGSHLLTLLATTGILSLALYLLLIIYIKFKTFGWILKSFSDEKWLPVFSLLAGWSSLAIAQLFYSSNMTLTFLFWIFSALLLSISLNKVKEVAFKKTPRVSFTLSFAFVVCAILIITTGFITVSRYAADIAFAQAVSHSESGESYDVIIEDLVTATQMNKWSDTYARNLSSALLYKSAELLNDPEVSPESIQNYIANSIEFAQIAVELGPNTVANYIMLGDVYYEVSPFVYGADEFAIEAYSQAIGLAPTNPEYFVLLGRAYISQSDLLEVLTGGEDEELAAQAQALQDQVLIYAVDAFGRSIELKSDYAQAQYYLALAYERQGNLSEAISQLETLQSMSPYDAGLVFQLGLLYLQQGKLDDAGIAFTYAIELSPEYSNARWFLSSVYEQQGDIESAIDQVELVLELNPENELILQRLERLNEGLVTEEELEPLEEGDEEIQ